MTELWEFLSRQYCFTNLWQNFQMVIKSSILNFWLSPFAWDLQLCIVWRWFHQNPKNLITKRLRTGGRIRPRNRGGINMPCLIGLTLNHKIQPQNCFYWLTKFLRISGSWRHWKTISVTWQPFILTLSNFNKLFKSSQQKCNNAIAFWDHHILKCLYIKNIFCHEILSES